MAKDGWKNVKNVKAFLEQKGNVRVGPHSPSKRIHHWPVCKNCGLVYLKNDLTRKAIKAKCVSEE